MLEGGIAGSLEKRAPKYLKLSSAEKKIAKKRK